MTKASPCPSEFALERWRFGELAASAEEAHIVNHVANCPACRDRQAALAATEQPPLDTEVIWAKRAAARGREGRRSRLWPAAALAAAAVSVLLLVQRRPAPDILTKGSWQLGVIAKSKDGRVKRVDPGASLSPGDRLRFEVSTDWPAAEIALVMLDSGGKVSRLAPAGSGALPIAGGKRVLVGEAVELDDSLGPERIVLVACKGSFGVPQVIASAEKALAQAGGDPRRVGSLGTGCHEESFWIAKVRP